MNIRIESIDSMSFQSPSLYIIASLVWRIPYFHIRKEELISQDSLKLAMSVYPHKIAHINILKDVYRFYPCLGESYQEYCLNTLQNLEKAPINAHVWVFLPIKDEYDEMDNNDTLGYVIGEIIQDSPLFEPYYNKENPLQSYTHKNLPPFFYKSSWSFLKIWDLQIPVGMTQDMKIWEKYKASCTIFTKHWRCPQYDGCLSIDGMITNIDLSQKDLMDDGIVL